MPFINTTLDVRTGNGLDDTLLECLEYVDNQGVHYRAPVGATTDGLSVPRCVQNIIPATGGDWFSGVLHDAAYRNQLEVQVNEYLWQRARLTKDACDGLLLEALLSQDCGEAMSHIIYGAVKECGQSSFEEDRKLNP